MQNEPIRFVDVNDPDEGVVAFLRALSQVPGDGGHEWVETSAFAGRFCARCGVDEDDQDDVRRQTCCPEAATVPKSRCSHPPTCSSQDNYIPNTGRC